MANYDEPLRTATWALLFLFAASLPWVVATALRAIHRGPSNDTGWARHSRPIVLSALLLGVCARLLVPYRLVMHYMGYELVEQARVLGVTPKYGPASFQLQHAILSLGEPTHLTVVWGHRVMGALLPVLAVAWVLRLGFSGRAMVWTALLTSLTPALIRDAATESFLVEATLWALGSAWLLADAARFSNVTKQAVRLTLAMTWALLAMLARPEMLATVPLLLVVTALLATWKHQPSRAFVVGLVAVAVILVWWRAEQMSAALVVERARGNTPRVFQDGYVALGAQLLRDAFWDKNGLLWPRFFPAATTFSLGLGLLLADGKVRVRLGWLVGLTAAWLLPSALDLPFVSVPRVQAPAMLLASISGGVALSIVHGCLFATSPGAKLKTVGASLALVWLATAALTVPALWPPGPAQQEEAIMQLAQAILPPRPLTVVARSYDDAPDERVHLAMPHKGWGSQGRLRPLHAVLTGAVKPTEEHPVYAWLGTRCFLRPCDEGAEHPACSQVRREFVLHPIATTRIEVELASLPPAFGQQVPDHSSGVADLDFPWCFTQRTMAVGLFRVGRRR